MDDKYQKIQDEIEKKKLKRKKRFSVSGKSVFDIKKMIDSGKKKK